MSFLVSCSATKIKKQDYGIVKTKFVVEKDTISVNELQFYKTIVGNYGTLELMYENYGLWNKRKKYRKFVWEDIKLFDEDNMTFTIIAQPVELRHYYDKHGVVIGHPCYAMLMVFDSNGKDCFKADYPNKEKITDLFFDKIKKIHKKSNSEHYYKLFDRTLQK